MSDISTITVNNVTYDLKDAESRAQNAAHHTYYVKGTQTAATGNWTGNLPDVEELYDGLTIDYWLPFAGNGNATLTLTLKNGVVTDAVPCYYANTTRLTTHIAALSVARLTYQTVTINNVEYTGWWFHLGYNTNTTDIVNLYEGSSGYCADSVVYPYKLLFQLDRHDNRLTPLNNANNNGTSKTMLTDVAFDPFGKIYYYHSTATINANGSMTDSSLYYHRNSVNLQYTFNCGTTLTANKDFYLKVIPQSNGTVKLAADPCWVQDLPLTDDGNWYVFLGRTQNTYQFVLYTEHPVFDWLDGEWKQIFDPKLATATASSAGLMSAADKQALDNLDSDFAALNHTHDDRYYTQTEIDDMLVGVPVEGHTHDDRYYTESEVDTILNGKSDTGHTHDDRYYTESEIDTALAGKADSSHTHDDRYYTESEIDTALAGKAASSHTHDDRYYTESEVDTLLNGKSDTGHTHNYVSKSGDTMTDALYISSNTFDDDTTPAAETVYDIIGFKDDNDNIVGSMRMARGDPQYGDYNGLLFQMARAYSNGVPTYWKTPFAMNMFDDGSISYYLNNEPAFRNAIGASSGIWPISLGGTGGTDSGWQTLTNASVFTGTIYYRQIGFYILLKGMQLKLANNLTTSSVDLLTGSKDIQPSGEIWTPAGSSAGMGIVRINTSSKITFYKPSSVSSWSSSSNIYFTACYIHADA